MTPPCHSFPASELTSKVQQDVRGRRRKMVDGGRNIDLSTCELQNMMQYKCKIEQPHIQNSPIHCFAVERFFRRCKDKNGTFTVETTTWEDKKQEKSPPKGADGGVPAKPYQWSPNWQDADTK